MPYTVFVSHTGQDYDLVKAIQQAADAKNVQIYTYKQDPQPGENLPDKLQGQIRDSDALVVLLTESGARNPAVHEEVGIAKEVGIPIIPVLDEGEISLKEAPFLQGVEHLSFNRSQPLVTVQRLAKRLDSLARERQQKLRRQEEQKRIQNQRALFFIGAALLLWASSEKLLKTHPGWNLAYSGS